MTSKPKISIITVVFNSVTLIEETIKSVLEQSYSNIEYIIIDGASTDGTLSIIESYRPKLAVLLSEKDKGIYDAMNKGLERATGDYVLFMNAGDLLYELTTLEKVFADNRYADVYYGNTKIIDLQGTILGDRRLKPPPVLNWKSLKYGMCVSHQSFIAKRELCDPYNLNYKLSADIDWVIRVLKKATTIVNANLTISKYLQGGASVKGGHISIKERYRIMVIHYGFFPTLFYHAYIVFRLFFQVILGKRKSID
jgi:glycosyltransferase involved in cell wall biosynthesis